MDRIKYPALAAVIQADAAPKGAGLCSICHNAMSKQDRYQFCPDCQEEISNAKELGLDYGSVASVTADSKYPTVAKITGH